MDIINTMIDINDDTKIIIGRDKDINVLYDEENNDITHIYLNNLNHFLQNPKLATRKILEWWEIRSWTHIQDNKFLNKEKNSWGHNPNEPLLGFGSCNNNRLFTWGKTIKEEWEENLLFNSYFYPQKQYRLLKILRANTSSGIIIEHVTESTKMLYFSFREMTSTSEIWQWFTGIFNLIDISKCQGVRKMPREMYINKGIWDHSYTNYNEKGNIRQQILDFINNSGIDLKVYDEIVLIGMSLGACICQYICLDLIWRLDRNKITMILFGSPRVYTPNVIKFLNKKGVICLRFEMDSFDDPPGFPCPHSNFFIQWKHLGVSIRMNSDVHYVVDDVIRNKCMYYLTREKKCNKMPYKPLALLQGTYNLHSRLPYSLHIYYAARKFDRHIPSVYKE